MSSVRVWLASALFQSTQGAAVRDPALVYEGRWEEMKDFKRADWPCSAIRFRVDVNDTEGSVGIQWHGLRTRINITARSDDGTVVYSSLAVGPTTEVFKRVQTETVRLPAGSYAISVRKLTSAAPFGTGIGGEILNPSVLEFHGLTDAAGLVLAPSPPPSRRMEFIGASDTAGYCVDGTPDMSDITTDLSGWKYENCDAGFTGELARRFDADLSVEAISGSGLTQNAGAKQRWQLGKLTMADYFNRTLQSDATAAVQPGLFHPDVVLVSLGGNDYNHQDGAVPSNETFSKSYEEFLLNIKSLYGGGTSAPKLIAICGTGDPMEAARDPDNDRCSPCPHVADAVAAFNSHHGQGSVEYIFIPCDGSVVTGTDDIGCAGHKNAKGQTEVADFLEPRIAKILGWKDTQSLLV